MSTTSTLARSSETATPAPVIRKGPRRDIQGLRAVAVLSVIANHLWGWPHGGFVGVDVFFVVSGFLITGLLIRERARDGRISFSTFYRRRIRRIMPAATAVIVVTVVATYLIVSATRAADVGRDGIWAFFFTANWHFGLEGTDYFNNDGVSPLQHYWSLAVEEQFYLVWPWVVLLGFWLTKGRGRTTAVLFTLMGTLTLASFVYALWHTANAPTWAYFSTFDRAWELGVGASLALAAPAMRRLPAWLAGALAWGGLAAILSSFFVVSESSGFPAPWALLPVMGTAAVIAGGVGHDQRHLLPLVNPISDKVGDLSYSLYLWHFPVIILLASLFPDRGVAYSLWCLGLMAALSVASYHLIENPVRHSMWLEPGMSRKKRRLVREPDRKLQLGWAGVLVVTSLGMVMLSLQPTSAPSTVVVAGLDVGGKKTGAASLEQQQTARVQASLEQESFPRTFTPSLDSLGWENWVRGAETGDSGFCYDVNASNLADCYYGAPADKTAVVLGDSYAMTWTPTVKAALLERNFAVQQLTLQQCPTWDVSVMLGSGAAHTECDPYRDWAVKTINALKPDIVFLASSHSTIDRLAPSRDGRSADERVIDGTADTLQALQPSGARLVVLAPPPQTGNLTECVTRLGSPQDCAASVSDTWYRVREAETAAVSASPNSEFIDTLSWFCFEDRCPAFVGTTPVTVDGGHLTREYAEELAPLLIDALRRSSRAGTGQANASVTREDSPSL